MDDYNNGFMSGAQYAFGMVRDVEHGIEAAHCEAYSVALDYGDWDVVTGWDGGYIDGIFAVIGHLEIPEREVVDHEECAIDTEYDLGAILMDAMGEA